jgi:hypothetical protein
MWRSIRITAGWSRAFSGRRASTISSRLAGRRPARGQQAVGVVVGPVVQDPREQVGVGPGGDVGEEVAGDQLAAPGDPLRLQPPAGVLDHRRPVDQDGAQLRRRREHRREQDAVAAADVDQPAEPAEVVGGDHVPGLLLGPAGDRALEDRLLVRVPGQVVEEPVPVDLLEGRAPWRTAASIPAAAR